MNFIIDSFQCERITNDFEIILVEDGGQDNSWDLIKEISKKTLVLKE